MDEYDGWRAHNGHFKKGQPGGPGRPKGSRSRLSEAFLEDMFKTWQEQGPDIIAKVIEKRPHEFLKVIASLLPRHVKLSETTSHLTDEQRAARLMGVFRALHQGGYINDEFGGLGAIGGGSLGIAGKPGDGQIIEIPAISETGGISQQPGEGNGADSREPGGEDPIRRDARGDARNR